jgi:FMN phosphatase YigB (HAD superfamily)
MEVLGVGPHETWMVGDNLEWEIVAPQRLGIYAIWHDGYGVGLPPTPRSAPTASSAAYRNCWSSRAAWCASNGTRQSSN